MSERAAIVPGHVVITAQIVIIARHVNDLDSGTKRRSLAIPATFS